MYVHIHKFQQLDIIILCISTRLHLVCAITSSTLPSKQYHYVEFCFLTCCLLFWTNTVYSTIELKIQPASCEFVHLFARVFHIFKSFTLDSIFCRPSTPLLQQYHFSLSSLFFVHCRVSTSIYLYNQLSVPSTCPPPTAQVMATLCWRLYFSLTCIRAHTFLLICRCLTFTCFCFFLCFLSLCLQ